MVGMVEGTLIFVVQHNERGDRVRIITARLSNQA